MATFNLNLCGERCSELSFGNHGHLGIFRIYIESQLSKFYVEIDAEKKYEIPQYEKCASINDSEKKSWAINCHSFDEMQKLFTYLCEHKNFSSEIADIIYKECELMKMRDEFELKIRVCDLLNLKFEEAMSQLLEDANDVDIKLYNEYLSEYFKKDLEDEEIIEKDTQLKEGSPELLDPDLFIKIASHLIAKGKLKIALRVLSKIDSEDVNRLRSQIVGGICKLGISDIPEGNAEDIILHMTENNRFVKIEKINPTEICAFILAAFLFWMLK